MNAPLVRVIRNHELVAEQQLGRTLRIGRLPDNDLVLDDELVSGHHGRLERQGPLWRYTDLGSTNGSIVAAGPTLRAGQSHELREDTQILLGNTVLEVRPGPVDADPQRGGPYPGGARAAAAPVGRPRVLVVLEGRCRSVPLTGERTIIGRSADCEVRIEHASISGHHAEIRCEKGQFVVRDRSSTNGTRIGLQRVTGPRQIHNGTHVIVGEADLLFVHDDDDATAPAQRDADTRVLDLLQRERRLSGADVREIRAELSRGGRQLGELLVLQARLSPGEWVEARLQARSVDASQADREDARRRRRLIVIVLLLAAALLLAVRSMTAQNDYGLVGASCFFLALPR